MTTDYKQQNNKTKTFNTASRFQKTGLHFKMAKKMLWSTQGLKLQNQSVHQTN